jgi:hypothetical protein
MYKTSESDEIQVIEICQGKVYHIPSTNDERHGMHHSGEGQIDSRQTGAQVVLEEVEALSSSSISKYTTREK